MSNWAGFRSCCCWSCCIGLSGGGRTMEWALASSLWCRISHGVVEVVLNTTGVVSNLVWE